MAGRRSYKVVVTKTFRFTPELVDDMERVLFLTSENGKKKYSSMTNLITIALQNLIKRERRALENQGVAWEHLTSNFKNYVEETKNAEED